MVQWLNYCESLQLLREKEQLSIRARHEVIKLLICRNFAVAIFNKESPAQAGQSCFHGAHRSVFMIRENRVSALQKLE
jgi:hypothetical protein